MKKLLVITIVSLVSLMLIVSGCDFNGGNQINENEEYVASKSKDLISFGAYSTVSLLSSFNGELMSSESNIFLNKGSQKLLLSTQTEDEDSTEDEDPTKVLSQIDLFNECYNMLKPFIDNQAKNIMNYIDLEEDEDYEYSMQVNIALGGNETQAMILKYNIVDQSIEYDDDDDDEFGQAEIESNFSGVLIIGETVYDFEGTSEIEEDEVEFEIKAEIDSENYVTMKIQTELGEIEYEYEISVNGVVKTVSIEIEEDEDQEFSIEIEIDNDGIQSKYELKRELEDDVLITKVEYDIDGESGEMYINITIDEHGNEIVEYSINPDFGKEAVIQKEYRNIFGD